MEFTNLCIVHARNDKGKPYKWVGVIGLWKTSLEFECLSFLSENKITIQVCIFSLLIVDSAPIWWWYIVGLILPSSMTCSWFSTYLAMAVWASRSLPSAGINGLNGSVFISRYRYDILSLSLFSLIFNCSFSLWCAMPQWIPLDEEGLILVFVYIEFSILLFSNFVLFLPKQTIQILCWNFPPTTY